VRKITVTATIPISAIPPRTPPTIAPTGTSLPLLLLLSPALGGGPGSLLVELGAALDEVEGDGEVDGDDDVEALELTVDGRLVEKVEELNGVVKTIVGRLSLELVLAGTETGVGARISCPA
jgi:hypothetical protein